MLRTALMIALFSSTAFAGSVTMKFQGTTKEALKSIAAQGGLNLIVLGDLNDPMEVYLTDASPEDALSTVASSARLHVDRKGTIYTVRKMTADEEKQAETALKNVTPPEQVVAPVPVVPTPPQVAVDVAAKKAALKELQKALKDKNLSEDARDQLEEHIDELQSEIDDAKEQARDAIEEAKEQAREAQEQAKEQARLQEKYAHKFPGGMSDGKDIVNTGHVTIAEDQSVNNAVAYGGGVDVLGTVERDVVAFGGNVHLGPKARVDGDVTAFGGNIVKEPGAEIGGEAVAFGGGPVGLAIAAPIAAPIAKIQVQHDTDGFSSKLASFFIRFAVLFAIGFLFSMFAPARMKALESEINAAPVRSLATGLVGFLAMIALTLLLTVTIIGIPFMIALWLMASLGFAMAFAAFASDIGMRLPFFRGRKTQALVLAVGLFMLLVAGLVPVLGPLALTVVGAISFGALIRTRFGSIRRIGVPEPITQIPA